MSFTHFLFLFAFLPVVLGINRFLPQRWSNVFLLITSLLFYFAGESTLVLLLICSIAWNYLGALTMQRWIQHKRFILGLAIAGNLMVLVYYKYAVYLTQLMGLDTWANAYRLAELALPLGISFFTFQGISYLVDVSRGEHQAAKNPIKVGLYIALFPQLIAGPIVKYKEIATTLEQRSTTHAQRWNGCLKFLRGLVKKVVFANQFALIADATFSEASMGLPSAIAWLGLVAYTLQIYYDFSGYSDMAIGLCRIMGFTIPENFNHPYIARSLRDFWRRWHISLSTWFRDYVYIPLGGSRVTTWRVYVNLCIVFFITGLWHGASTNFVLWGLMHGTWILLERRFANTLNRLPRWLQHGITLLVVMLTWVFFRLENLHDASLYFTCLFQGMGENFFALTYTTPYLWTLLAAGALLTTPLRHALVKWRDQWLNPKTSVVLQFIIYGGAGLFCWMEMSSATYQSFIYFKF